MPDWDARPPDEQRRLRHGHHAAETVDAARRRRSIDEQVEEGAKPLGLWSDTWRRLKRNKLALVGLGIIIVFITVGTVEEIAVRASASRSRRIRPDEVNYALSPQGLGSPPSWSTPSAPTTSGVTCCRACSMATRIAMLVGIIAVAIALDHRPHPRPDLGVLRRRGRLGDHAHRRCLLRLPLHPVRAAAS